jgi:D-glycero-alpha-D-manno-heptose 1-phosphate guanylyltransferase
MKAVVLAGGLGTRLRERVPDLPKPMAPVAGRPFLAYVLDALVRDGFSAIVLSVGYRWEAIQAHFGSSYRGAAITYAVEEEPLGTGGAVAHAFAEAGITGTQPALVVNGDTFLALDFAALRDWYEEAPGACAMVLRQVDDTSRYGSVSVADGMVSGFAEKGRSGPGLINAGVYVLQANVFARFGLEGRFALEADLLQGHCAALGARAFETAAWFIDIGVPQDFDRAQTELPAILK